MADVGAPDIAEDDAPDIAEDIAGGALDIAEEPPPTAADGVLATDVELGEPELLFEPQAANASRLAASIVTVPTRRIRPTVPPSLSIPTIARPNGCDPLYFEMTIRAPAKQNLAER